MIIRQATRDDAPVLARMRWDFRSDGAPVDDSYPAFEAHFIQFYAEALSNGRWMIWVMEQDGEIISQTWLQLIEKVPRPGVLDQQFAYVTNVYTRPQYRGQGLGAQMMEHVVEWAKARQLEFLVLWPSERSVPFYQRGGFDHSEALQISFEDH